MPLIKDYDATQALYRRCAEHDLVMARLGYASQDEIYGIVKGAARFASEHGIRELPLGIFSTVGHYILQTLPRYLEGGHVLPSKGGDPAAYRRILFRNCRLATAFMEILTDPADSDFGAVAVTHHYDHGHHTLPGGKRSEDELLCEPEFLDMFSSVMFDDTHSPFEENVASSIEYRRFVEGTGRKKVMEGCLEEVAAGGQGLAASQVTDPSQIEEYLARTGFELVVPNIGTESIHARAVGVQWGVLEAICERGIGHRLVVHGFSSIRKLAVEEQRRLGTLGVVGMNAYSYIPQHIGPQVLERAARLVAARDAQKGHPIGFTDDGTPRYDTSGDANVFFAPLLDEVRDFRVGAIAGSVYEILENLGYARLSD